MRLPRPAICALAVLAVVTAASALTVSSCEDPEDWHVTHCTLGMAAGRAYEERGALTLSASGVPWCDAYTFVEVQAFESISAMVRGGRGGGEFWLKLIDRHGSEYWVPRELHLPIADLSKWTRYTLSREQFVVAPWSADEDGALSFPLRGVTVVVWGVDGGSTECDFDAITVVPDRSASAMPKWLVPGGAAVGGERSTHRVKVGAYAVEVVADPSAPSITVTGPDGARYLDSARMAWNVITTDAHRVFAENVAGMKFASDGGDGQVVLLWTGPHLAVRITLSARGANALEARLALRNAGLSTIREVTFPFDLAAEIGADGGVVYPYYAGVRLLPEFFSAGRDRSDTYPGPLTADLLVLDRPGASVALYGSQLDDAWFHPCRLRVSGEGATGGAGGTGGAGAARAHLRHAVLCYVPAGAEWSAPPLIMGFGGGRDEILADYKRANGLEGASSLREKVGDEVFEKLRYAFMYRSAIEAFGGTFQAAQRAATGIDGPAIVHLITYWERGFDQNYPDYLPPKRQYGTPAEFGRLISECRKAGKLVMPYTNSTWWDAESPTMKRLGTSAAVVDIDGRPVWERYGSDKWGMVVNPWDERVRKRIDENIDAFTGEYAVDILFQDQVSARGPRYTLGEGAPFGVSYTAGLLVNAARHCRRIPIMSESGWDRFAKYESGFWGLTIGLLPNVGASLDHVFGEGLYRMYPTAVFICMPHTALYHHNLGQMVVDDLTLGWTLALGHNMSTHDVGKGKWYGINRDFQRAVCSRYIGTRMVDFAYLTPDVTRTEYPGTTVIACHSREGGYRHGSETLAPMGCAAYDEEGRLIAGLLTRAEGRDLAGPTYMVRIDGEVRTYPAD